MLLKRLLKRLKLLKNKTKIEITINLKINKP